MAGPHPPRDASGLSLAPGDVVRVVGLPDLGALSADDPLHTRDVFAHLLGTYRRIADFDGLGHAHLDLRIRRGPLAGLHSVWIEPWLLRRRRRRGEGAQAGHAGRRRRAESATADSASAANTARPTPGSRPGGR